MLVSRMARQEVTATLVAMAETSCSWGMAPTTGRIANKLHFKLMRRPISRVLNVGNDRSSVLPRFSIEAQQLPSHIFSQEQYLFSEKEVSQLLVKDASCSPDNQLEKLVANSTCEAQAFYDEVLPER